MQIAFVLKCYEKKVSTWNNFYKGAMKTIYVSPKRNPMTGKFLKFHFYLSTLYTNLSFPKKNNNI